MEYSQNYNFNLPSRDKDDIVDINLISDNFRVIDTVLNNAQNNAYIKNNKLGSIVSANDVSPVEHELKVSVASKNILPYPYIDFTQKGNPVTVNGVTFTDNGDGSITINGTSTAQTYFGVVGTSSPLKLEKGKTYTLSGFPTGYNTSTAYLNIRNTTYQQHIRCSGSSVTFTAEHTDYYSQIYINSGVTLNNVVIKPQLEEGITATAFALYVADLTSVTVYEQYSGQIATPKADGTVEGLTSVSPNMTVFSDKGVNIDLIYNADTKTYIDNKFAELQAAIVSLGGNV